jgi:hypothetical protein
MSIIQRRSSQLGMIDKSNSAVRNVCASTSRLLIYPVGKGRVIVSTLRILENPGKHPAADRLLINLVNFADKTAEPT